LRKLLLFPLTLFALAAFAVTPAGSGTASDPYVFRNIDQLSGWDSCDSCAGFNGSGPKAPHSMEKVSSPSLDGAALQFDLGGSTPYARALWWNSLTRSSSLLKNTRHFILDAYFYLTNPNAPYAMEYAVTQYISGHKLNFGMQCNVKGTHMWDVSSGESPTWKASPAPCAPPAPFKWHHVVMEFERLSGDDLRYVSINYDGKLTIVNRVYSPHSDKSTNLTFHYQMDGNKQMTNYSTWLDKVTLKMW